MMAGVPSGSPPDIPCDSSSGAVDTTRSRWERLLCFLTGLPGTLLIAIMISADSPSLSAIQKPRVHLKKWKHVLQDEIDQIGVNHDDICDICPCTSAQEALVALSVANPRTYVARYVYSLTPGTDLARFHAAIETVVLAHTILRTRVIQTSHHGSFQAVMRNPISITKADSLDLYLEEDLERGMSPGSPYLRLALITPSAGSNNYFVVTLHHALYDDWSLNQVLHEIECAYRGDTIPPRCFSDFTVYALEASQSKATLEYWARILEGAEQSTFPPLPSGSYKPMAKEFMTQTVELDWLARLPESTQTAMVELAWAIVLARYTDVADTTFGVTFTGRGARFPGVDRMSGPTIATVPRRVQMGPNEEIHRILSRMEAEEFEMTPFEQCGLYNIRQLGGDAAAACQFQNLLVIQAPLQHEYEYMTDISNEQRVLANHATFGTYALTWVCDLLHTGVRIQAVFDEEVLPKRQMRRLQCQFVSVISSFGQDLDRGWQDAAVVCSEDMAELQRWNGMPVANADKCVHNLVRERCLAQPNALAVSAWDGDFLYGELDELSRRLAFKLRGLGVVPGDFVPLYFWKSRWTTVAVLAVMKAGAAFVLLDPSLPVDRIKEITRQTETVVVLTSPELVSTTASFAAVAVIVGNDCAAIQAPPKHHPTLSDTSPVTPRDPVYVVFTSGSTGTPKGVVIEHGSFATSTLAYIRAAGMNQTTRALQFASYAFDVSVSDTLVALVAGATLCVPSEEERKGDLVQTISKYQITWADFTPSLMRQFRPAQMPTLRTLVLGGEPMSPSDVSTWSPYVHLLNTYGPAECCVLATIQPNVTATTGPRDIGTGNAAICWVVDPQDHRRLAPVSAIGELILEGPIVGRGYLNGTVQTAQVFVEPPAWLRAFRQNLGQPAPSRLYKTGDLVQYTPQGSLQYVGRKDLQVKLRGQRIELGEVEHHVRNAFPNATDAIVDMVSLLEGQMEPQLVAWVKLEGDEDTSGSALLKPWPSWTDAVRTARERLRQLVPNFMIPYVFFPVHSFPRTMSDKIDRRRLKTIVSALSREEVSSYQTTSRAKTPVTSDDALRLQELWAKILRIKPSEIGAGDGFVDLGGDSITAMTTVTAAKSEGMSIKASDLLQNRDLQEISRGVRDSPVTSKVNWVAETALGPNLVGLEKKFSGEKNGVKNTAAPMIVTLTGATGFLGSRILRQLIESTNIQTIHCVAVRNHSSAQLPTSDKVVVHPGDLTKPGLGVDTASPPDWVSKCNAIIHCGADVSYAKDYAALRSTNVHSTRQLASWAITRDISIHYISTVALAHFPGLTDLPEASIRTHTPEACGSGYLATKWVSEVLLEAVNSVYNIPVTIYRASSIVGLAAPSTDLTNAVLRCSRSMKCTPDLRSQGGFVDLIRVETIARDIVDTVLSSWSGKATTSAEKPVTYIHESGEIHFPIAQLRNHLEEEEGTPIHEQDLSSWLKQAPQYGMPASLSRFLDTSSPSGLDISLPFVESRWTRLSSDK